MIVPVPCSLPRFACLCIGIINDVVVIGVDTFINGTEPIETWPLTLNIVVLVE